MMKRILLSWLILAALGGHHVFAKGTQEKDFQEAQGKDNFSQKVDLSKLKPGQYNILVRTKDAAGNVSFAGPYNFFYDPSSDNPLMTVANPAPGQRIGSSLNVVGVASAPKGVALVEAKVDGGDWAPAKGKAFWSYFLAITGMPDGLHQISVRGTDVNGVVGPIMTVPFHVDQQLPVFTLTNYQSGDRVSGVISLSGSLADGNGLSSLELSTNDGKAWTPLDLQGDSRAVTRNFNTTLDTKKFPDGPLVIWFHGTDGQGSETRRAILLFVDNTLPAITVLSPAPDAGLHGVVRFALRVEKTLGIQSLAARVGEKGTAVPIKVVPGNPFSVVDLELPAHGTGTVPVIIEAVDTAGKLGRITYLAHLNGDTDLPEFTLATALEKAQVKPPFHLVGTLQATDGPGGMAWSLNGSTETVEPVGASFDFLLPGLIAGANKVVLTPIDANSKRGKPVAISFTAMQSAPTVIIEALVFPDGETPFRPGIGVAPDKKAKIRTTVVWPNPPKTVTWTLGDKTLPVPVSGRGPTTFLLPLPDDPPFGTVPLTITATDLYDQVTAYKTFIDITNFAKPQGPEGMAFADARVGASPLVVTPETPLRGYFAGGKIRTADLLTGKGTVPQSVLQVTHDDQFVTIKAVKDGQFDAVKLRVVNDRGRVYETDLGPMIADLAPPTITLSSPLSGSWARENLRVDGQVSDSAGVTKLEWSIDNGKNWQALDPPSGQGGSFSRQLTLPGPDNMVNLLIRASDNAGRTGTVLTVVRRDTTGPAIDLTMPTLTPDAQGTVIVVGRLKDDGALQKAEATINRKTFALPIDKPFTLNLDAAAIGTSPLSFRVTDWAGNVTEQNFTLPAADPAATATPAAAPKPQIEILFPKADTKGLNGVIPIVGRVTAFSSPPTVSVKGEAGTTPVELTNGGYFSLEANVSTLKNRSLTFTAGAGKEAASLSMTLPYDPASELPQARFLNPGEKPVVTGNVSVSGWIGDSRGVVSWISQLDAGEKKTVTPDAAKPPVGAFVVDLGLPAAGPHKLTVWPVNAQGQQGPPAVAEFISTLPAGPVTFTNVDLAASLAVTKDSRVQGRVPSINNWRSMEIRFADLAAPDPWNGPFQPLPVKKDSEGIWTFDVPVPASLPFSRIGVVVRGEDVLGQKVEGRTLFHRVWPKDAALIQDAEGVVFLDNRLQDGKAEISPGQPLAGIFRGRPIKTLALEPPVPALDPQFVGSSITLDTKDGAEGLFGPFAVVVTTVDGEIFKSTPLTLFDDTSGPLLEWELPANAEWIRDSVNLKGKVSDPSTVAALETSVDGGTNWQVVPVRNGVFDVKVPVAAPDGLVSIVMRATDKGGHVTLNSRAITKDASAPAWTLIAPPEDRKVNGLTTLIGTATDLNPITLIEYSDDGKTFKPADGKGTFAFDLDFASYAKLPDKFSIRATDSAGNQAVLPLVVPLDQAADKPVVQIQTPVDGEVVRSDFLLSGMAFDDDGIKTLSWRIDSGTWLKLEGVSSFQIPIALTSLTDNEHTIEVQAEDIYGTKGDVFKSVFKVSLEAPSAVLFTPEIDKTVSGVVGLVGGSFDRNGIEGVEISLDNGLTWNRANLRSTEAVLTASAADQVKAFLPAQRREWEWRFESRTLKDGTYLVMIKTTDKYGTEGLSTTLVNLDNTAPSLTLTSPTDGQAVLDKLELEGRGSDNITMVTLHAELRPIEAPIAALPQGRGLPIPAASPTASVVLQTDLPVTPTFNNPWNIGTLAPGWYNLRLEAKDAAGNATYVARNIRVEGASADKVDVLYPQAGESLTGTFVLEGRVTSRTPVDNVVVSLDSKVKVTGKVDAYGYFTIPLDGTNLEAGTHTLVASVQPTAATTLTSESKTIFFDPLGPWIQVVSHHSGSFVTQRPFITGRAGWNAAPLDPAATPEDAQKYRRDAESHKVASVEVSLDNGKTWGTAQGEELWKYRLESLALPDGPQPLVFRAKFRDGSVAVQRLLVTVAQTPPQLKLLTPIENGRFNGSVDLAGFTEGDGQVQAVEIAVRQGDKAGYEVPQFIQGAYLDAHFLGATLWEAGFGLTFFQEAVKLQAQLGQTPEYLGEGVRNRFWGTVAGAKLIASILQLPAGYYFGPDWSWLSSSFGVGATFNQFSMSGGFLDFTSKPPVMLGGVVLQWEMARVLARDWLFFKSASLYSEATVYFISSDVDATAKWVFSGGLRIGVF